MNQNKGILGTDTLPHVGIHSLRTNYMMVYNNQ